MSAALISPGCDPFANRGLVSACTELLGYTAAGKTLCPVVLLVEPAWVVGDATVWNNPAHIDLWDTTGGVSARTATSFLETAGGATFHYCSQLLTSARGPLTFWAEVSSGLGRNWGYLASIGPSWTQYFNATAGTLGGSTNCVGGISAASTPGHYIVTMTPNLFNVDLTKLTVGVAAGDGTASYAGDITNGLNVHASGVIQTSCAALLNQNGDVALASWGDRCNGVQATKSAQPVVGYINGRMVLIFSAANTLTIDAIGALLGGSDIPAAVAVSYQHSANTANQRIWGLGNSANADGYMELAGYVGGKQVYYRQADDAAALITGTGGNSSLARRTAAMSFPGTTLTTLLDGAAELTAFAADVNSAAFNRFTLGAQRRNGAASNFLAGSVRCLVIGLATPSNLAAMSGIVTAYAG